MGIEVRYPADILEEDGSSAVIFLNGPIQGAPDWQSQAIELIQQNQKSDGLIVASPRKDYAAGEFEHERQVDWETYYRARAAKLGVHLFWLANQSIETPGRSYAQTSRFELAESKMLHQFTSLPLVVGIEPGFGNERYIRRRFSQDCPAVPIVGSLTETCDLAVSIVKSKV